MNVFDPLDGLKRNAYLRQRATARRAFQQDVERLAHDGERTPENQRGDEDGEHGIDPVVPGEQDGGAADDDRGGRKRVAQHVNEGAADVDVARGGPEQGGDHAVHQHAGGGDDHHEPGLHLNRLAEAVDGRDGDPDGDHDQRERVEKGRQDAGALVAEGLLSVGGRVWK